MLEHDALIYCSSTSPLPSRTARRDASSQAQSEPDQRIGSLSWVSLGRSHAGQVWLYRQERNLQEYLTPRSTEMPRRLQLTQPVPMVLRKSGGSTTTIFTRSFRPLGLTMQNHWQRWTAGEVAHDLGIRHYTTPRSERPRDSDSSSVLSTLKDRPNEQPH